MLSKEERKEAARKFKERKPPLGVYAVRCAATGQVWVGFTQNLNASKNGIWLGLSTGAHHDKALQAEWNAHTESAFSYEVLEQLDEELSPLLVRDTLKARKQHWIERLDARG